MISYKISLNELRDLIELHKPNWLERAKERTENFKILGAYEESSSIWSEIKEVYFQLQGEGKCLFCERKMETVTYGRIEQDVEHFRPKKLVKKWTNSIDIVCTNPPPDNKGYFLLAYHPFNYGASCKPCNSTLKSNFFPIKGSYDFALESPLDALQEQALLIYPIGEIDDAEKLIKFHGVVPMPVQSSGYEFEKAISTIDIFQLDNEQGRKNLFRERAMVIILLFTCLENVRRTIEVVDNQAIMTQCIAFNAPHINCAKSFKRLYENDFDEAKDIFDY